MVMAATLLSIKSKMLLPNYDSDNLIDIEFDEVDPREELIRRLIEYKKYKEMSSYLKKLEINRSQIFTRSPADLSAYLSQEEDNPVDGISLYYLVDAFERVLIKYSYRDPLTKIEREEISIKDKSEQILNLLRLRNGVIHFSEILEPFFSRTEIIISFLSILELMKQRVIMCIQSKTFDDIVIHYTPIGDVDENGLQ